MSTEADQVFEAVKDCTCYEDAVVDLADQYDDTEGFVAVVAIAFGVSEEDVWAKMEAWHGARECDTERHAEQSHAEDIFPWARD